MPRQKKDEEEGPFLKFHDLIFATKSGLSQKTLISRVATDAKQASFFLIPAIKLIRDGFAIDCLSFLHHLGQTPPGGSTFP